jgi:hypothetical protein
MNCQKKRCRVACPNCGSTDVALYGAATDDNGDGELTRIEAHCACHPSGHEFHIAIAELREGEYGMRVIVQMVVSGEETRCGEAERLARAAYVAYMEESGDADRTDWEAEPSLYRALWQRVVEAVLTEQEGGR